MYISDMLSREVKILHCCSVHFIHCISFVALPSFFVEHMLHMTAFPCSTKRKNGFTYVKHFVQRMGPFGYCTIAIGSSPSPSVASG